ncbi:hypothetical protein YC2023_114713 [Brassica napus]
MTLAPNAYPLLKDWIWSLDGKLSFLGYAKFLHGVIVRSSSSRPSIENDLVVIKILGLNVQHILEEKKIYSGNGRLPNALDALKKDRACMEPSPFLSNPLRL